MDTPSAPSKTLCILGITATMLLSVPCMGAPRCSDAAVHRVSSAAVAIELTTPGGPAYGSGIVWDRAGHIVTNHHVVAAGTNPIVTFASGQRYFGTVVADAPDRDIAVLAVSVRPDVAVDLAGDGTERNGQAVLAIGNPMGQGMSLISGTLEARDQQIMIPPGTALTDLLQTDLPFRPGNSGGPVFDCAGSLIGMAAATMPRNTGMGITGYVIPASHLRAVVASLGNTGPLAEATVPTPSVGAPDARPGLGLMVVPGLDGTLVVDRVVPGTPAAMAGAAAGDVIAGLNGRPVSRVADLSEQVQRRGVGALVVLTVSRSGRNIDLPVRIMPVNFAS